MPLVSQLFGGDPALEACQVRDSAHLVIGTRGSHVGKVQQALFALEGAAIDASEVRDELYGPSTAAAVLDYKQKRKIINFAYQKTADNIVGKMTITRLDQDITELEGGVVMRGCPDTCRGAGGGFFAERVGFAEGDIPPVKTLLACMFQLVRAADKHGDKAFDLWVKLPKRANELLAPHGMEVRAAAGMPFGVPRAINSADEKDLNGLRKAAETAWSGLERVLRVIVVPFRIGDGNRPDMETNARSVGELQGVKGFPNFVVVNANIMHSDAGTLLHEMIHCSSNAMMSDVLPDHGDLALDKSSIFAYGSNRTRINVGHAALLRRAYFAFGKG